MTQANISPRKPFRPSAIWIIPFVAIILGGWLLLDNYLSQGPRIEVTFQTAEGIKPGETLVKRLSVELGIVEEVFLNEGYSDVTAIIQLFEGTEDLLRQDTQFWVVRPRIGAEGITGLSTILSGASIELAPGSGTPGIREFTGLEDEPTTPLSTPGLRVRLVAEQASSLISGSPVLYNGYKVGRVEETVLSVQDGLANHALFIDAPYHDLVSANTKFWNSSGISFQAGVDGISLRTESLESLIAGGVSFGLPDGVEPGERIDSEQSFRLYSNYSDIGEVEYQFSREYLLLFDSSIRGLAVGAPVEYRGLRIGTVVEIAFELVGENNLLTSDGHALMPVLIRLDPGRTNGDTQAQLLELESTVTEGIGNGLRAGLANGNLITGNLYVSLDFYDDVAPAEITVVAGQTVLPTVDGGLALLERQLGQVLTKMQDLPIEDTLIAASDALESVVTTVASADQTFIDVSEILNDPSTKATPLLVETALSQLTDALAGISPGSAIYSELNAALSDLREALKNARELTATLEAQPSSLIFPEPATPDLIPQVAPR